MDHLLLAGLLFAFMITEITEAQNSNFITHHVKVGTDAILTCILSSDEDVSNATVRWSRKEEGYLTIGKRILKHQHILNIIQPAPNEWNLMIKKVPQSFADEYTCNTSTGDVLSKVKLVVDQPPKIDEKKSTARNISVSENSKLNLVCIASGEPAPNITWFRRVSFSEQERKATGVSGSEFIIRNITRYATGVYTCLAKNSINTAQEVTWDIHVTVTFTPEVMVMEPVVYHTVGEPVYMACVIQGSPLHQVYWTNNYGVRIHISTWKYQFVEEYAEDGMPIRFLTLVIKQGTLSDHDYGTYTCQAKQNDTEVFRTVELLGLV